MQKLLNGCESVMLYVSTLSTFILMLLTTADAGGRYIFNRPITGAYEITTNYLMIAAIFMAVGFGYREGAYIRVTFLVNHLPRKVKLVVNHFVQLFSLIYGVLLGLSPLIKQALRTFVMHTTLEQSRFYSTGAGLRDCPCRSILHVLGDADSIFPK